MSRKIKVGLIIDEYFGALGTGIGGYGFLARYHIAKYIPNDEIDVEVLLGRGQNYLSSQTHIIDGIKVHFVPKRDFFAKRWLKKQNFDIYLSIELVSERILKNVTDLNKKLILWIQDPRPQYEWDEIHTVKLFPEPSYYNQAIYDLVHDWYQKDRVFFISQAHCLNKKAIDLYRLKPDVSIQYLPNPVDIDANFDVKSYPKKNNIVFLGRLESVKRGWLFCEIAKKMPEYDFYVMGKAFRDKSKNSQIFDKYKNIKNLHFVGHVEGKEKEAYLKDAKILVNTSIHEALPVSFLEAMSFGTLLVSNRNPDNLTSQFGRYVGEVLGDGFDKVDLYVNAIRELLNNDEQRKVISQNAVDYVKKVHSVKKFQHDLREVIKIEVGSVK